MLRRAPNQYFQNNIWEWVLIQCWFLSISHHFRDGVGSVGTSKWIFPPERINPFAAEGETSKEENNATAELNNTDVPDVSLH